MKRRTILSNILLLVSFFVFNSNSSAQEVEDEIELELEEIDYDTDSNPTESLPTSNIHFFYNSDNDLKNYLKEDKSIQKEKRYFIVDLRKRFAKTRKDVIIDSNGNEVFSLPEGHEASTNSYPFFEKGFLRVFSSDGNYIVNEKGETILGPNEKIDYWVRGDSLFSFAEKRGKRGLLNGKKDTLISPIYDKISIFSEGLAAVVLNGKTGFINAQGKLVIPTLYNEEIKSKTNYPILFKEGLAKVTEGKRIGYMDSTGKIVIKPRFSKASNFNEGLANVTSNDTIGFIDYKGNWVMGHSIDSMTFYSHWNFENDLLPRTNVKTGLRGYVDSKNNWVIPPNYRHTVPFKEDVGFVEDETGIKSFIDPQGNILYSSQVIRSKFDVYGGVTALSVDYFYKILFDKSFNVIWETPYSIRTVRNLEQLKSCDLEKLEGVDVDIIRDPDLYAKYRNYFAQCNLVELSVYTSFYNRPSLPFPTEVLRMNKLRSLKLQNIGVEEIPKEVSNLSELVLLDLSGNRLTTIPDELFNIKKLKSLVLSDNNFKEEYISELKKKFPRVKIHH